MSGNELDPMFVKLKAIYALVFVLGKVTAITLYPVRGRRYSDPPDVNCARKKRLPAGRTYEHSRIS
jgi:hypothetical protein